MKDMRFLVWWRRHRFWLVIFVASLITLFYAYHQWSQKTSHTYNQYAIGEHKQIEGSFYTFETNKGTPVILNYTNDGHNGLPAHIVVAMSGRIRRIVYSGGDHPCANQQYDQVGRSLKRGDLIRAAGKVIRNDTISVCDSEEDSLELVQKSANGFVEPANLIVNIPELYAQHMGFDLAVVNAFFFLVSSFLGFQYWKVSSQKKLGLRRLAALPLSIFPLVVIGFYLLGAFSVGCCLVGAYAWPFFFLYIVCAVSLLILRSEPGFNHESDLKMFGERVYILQSLFLCLMLFIAWFPNAYENLVVRILTTLIR